jgi:signal transduction histidine kinase
VCGRDATGLVDVPGTLRVPVCAQDLRSCERRERRYSLGENVEKIIEDILTLSRAGQTVEDPEQVVLADGIRERWDTVRTEGADIEFQVPETVTHTMTNSPSR